MRFVSALLLASMVAVAVVGCGGGGVAPEPEATETTQMIVPILDQIAQTGNLEDVGEELLSYVEEDLMETDPTKAESLMPDVKELLSMTSPAEIKAKAAEIKGKL